MPGLSHGRLRQQVDTFRREFLQEGELPFADVLSSGCLAEALTEIQRPWKDRIFNPLMTLWVFLGQVLNADQSCRAAVARLLAHRAAGGCRRAARTRAATARRGGACPSGSSPPWPASSGGPWTRGSINGG